MICPNCGSENKDDATFCQFCGQRFGPKTNQTADAENSKTEDTMYGEWNTKDTGNSQNQAADSQQLNYGWNNTQSGNDAGWNHSNNGWNNPQDNYGGSWNNQQGGPENNWNNQPNWNSNDGWNQNQQGWSGNNYQNNNYQSNGYQQPWNNGSQPYNGFAIASLIIGILSILPCCLFPYIGIPMNIVGLVLGIIGYRKPYGRGMSIAAIVINIIFLVLAIVWLIICLYIYANIDMNAYYQMFEDYMY